MSLELRNKKISETFEKYKIAQWGNGNGIDNLRTVCYCFNIYFRS